MTNPTEFEPFAGIVQRALAGRDATKGDLETHPEHNAPRYVVSMCEALTKAIHDAGHKQVTLAEVVRLEGTCTGADYSHKLAMRCHRLAHGATA
ncbi:hypothetical protein N0609_11495 [Pseudomonas aeruginosa]|nr:hypothetical protein [Pseudomonas aeruginosa]MCS8510385.1 hypothetical protein [Pseudomonas aeruginosa]MCS8541107.1 hypothetical protein [Pseudomonas aeruginosa]MCT0600253.1 hypothetical protein [Pseudomonas aeruginosa]